MDWLRGEIDRLFEDFGRPASSIFSFGNRSPAAPVPAVELVDDGKAYRLTAELPGLSEQDIAVSIADGVRSEEHTSELQSLMRISYAVFCLKKKNKQQNNNIITNRPDAIMIHNRTLQ